MKNELDKQLCEKYPKIFRDRHAPMTETCMCWGLEVGDGWYNLIDTLCHQIQQHIDGRAQTVKRNIRFNKMINDLRAGDTTLFDKLYDAKQQRQEPYQETDEQYAKRKVYVEQQRMNFLHSDTYFREIQELVPQVIAVQVKEKFGGLRFYYDGGDDTIHGMVSLAESLSYTMCEECGAPGTTGGRGWIKTRCTAHIKPGEEDYFNKQPTKWVLATPDDDEE